MQTQGEKSSLIEITNEKRKRIFKNYFLTMKLLIIMFGTYDFLLFDDKMANW